MGVPNILASRRGKLSAAGISSALALLAFGSPPAPPTPLAAADAPAAIGCEAWPPVSALACAIAVPIPLAPLEPANGAAAPARTAFFPPAGMVGPIAAGGARPPDDASGVRGPAAMPIVPPPACDGSAA